MGGCRCTYRNCTVKSDGKTHMFHYPVFEKVRCHQWLVNAHRLEFLDLKVSQLKNRVICQHHFKEENFMNYKKDKLTFDAVPTENGPFCDPSKFVDSSKAIAKSYPNLILLEDIENEVVFNDKKANFALKYGDFLTNGELTDSSTRYNSKNINLTKDKSKTISEPHLNLNDIEISKQHNMFKIHCTRLPMPKNSQKKIHPQPMLVVSPYTDLSFELAADKDISQDQSTVSVYEPNNTSTKALTNNSQGNNSLVKSNNQVCQKPSEVFIKKEPKIEILSEKKVKIQGPIPVTGKLKKVSPSVTLSIPEKNRDESMNVNTVLKNETSKNQSEKLKILEVLDVEFENPQTKNTPTVSTETSTKEPNLNNSIPQPQPKMPQIKNKITPERSAMIEKKRKFNMKMKDILETCLDKLDEPVKVNAKNLSPIKTSSKSLIRQPIKEESAIIGKEETQPSVQDYTIAYLDSRMKAMEKVLLDKIEQNSQTIMNLKNSFINVNKHKVSCTARKHAYTQTNTNEDCYKKFLYQEISKYLSQDSNSLIFEELFINKYSRADTSPLRKKLRKCI